MRGTIVKLDRGFPLVQLEDGSVLRCEHATTLVKGKKVRAVIGDEVDVSIPDGHDKGIIGEISPRRTAFVRKDPAERTAAQVLAANFDSVIIAEPIVQLNAKRLERELVLAHETGARVAVVLTKADLASDPTEVESVSQNVADLAGHDVAVAVMSIDDPASIERVRSLIPKGEVAVLIGKSGVGKSSLVNLLAGDEVQEIGDVRESDGKGRHTTVDRVMIEIPGAGRVVDMPGVRGLGLWDSDTGIDVAFADIAELARQCRFRDCKHSDEPGCAVLEAVQAGELAQSRLNSYRSLVSEVEATRKKREESQRMRGEKASDRKRQKRAGR
ncbi:MAG: ribosome small subunit-dependent GTPase A [Eggerthellaceae bacterium]|nr:ribosome small subunit-dependent GTPase A [Eggerthellaceae bacterium]